MWNAFDGYSDVYGKLPPARLVRRVRKLLIAENEYEAELQEKQREELEELKRKNPGTNTASSEAGRRVSVGG